MPSIMLRLANLGIAFSLILTVTLVGRAQELAEDKQAVVMFDLQVQTLQESEVGKKLRDLIREPIGPFTPPIYRDNIASLRRVFGLLNTPESLEVFSGPKPEVFPMDGLVRLQFADAEAADSVYNMLTAGMSDTENAGKAYKQFDAFNNVVFHRFSKDTIEFGTKTYVFHPSRKLGTARLSEAFSKVPRDAVRIAADVAGRRKFFNGLVAAARESAETEEEKVGAEAAANLILKSETLSIAAGFASKYIFTFTSTAENEADGAEIENLLKGLLALKDKALEQIAEDEASDMLGSTADGIRVGRAGKMVRLGVPQPEGLAEALSSWNEALSQVPMVSMGDDEPLATRYSKFQIDDLYEDATDLKTQFEKELPSAIARNAFVMNYFKPMVSVEIDPLPMKNIRLVEQAKVKVTSVTSKSGKEIGMDEEASRIRFGSGFGSNLNIRTKATEDDPPSKASVTMTLLQAPSKALRFDLDTNTKKQSRDGVSVELKSIRGNSVEVSYRGAAKVQVAATDDTGGMLDRSGSFGTPSFKSVQFYGEPTKVTVIALVGASDIEIEAELDLNDGQRHELPEDPSDDVPVRFATFGDQFHTDFDPETLANLKVEWIPPSDNGFGDGHLALALGEGQPDVRSVWEGHFFGADSPLVFNEIMNAHIQDRALVYRFPFSDGAPPDVRMAFGKVMLDIGSELEILKFVKVKDGDDIEVKSSKGDAYVVSIDRNGYTLPKGNSRLMRHKVFDANGRQLRKSNSKAWGQIHSLELEVQGPRIKRVVEYSIPVGQFDAAKLEAFKDFVAAKRKVGRNLMKLGKAVQQGNPPGYAATLAGFHFVHASKDSGEPMDLISKELAESDPEGVEQFGYEAKPVDGYFFTFAKGDTDFQGKPRPRVTERTRKRKYYWKDGEFEAPRVSRSRLIALPVDPKNPVFIYNSGQIRSKVLPDGKLEYTPSFQDMESWAAETFVAE